MSPQFLFQAGIIYDRLSDPEASVELKLARVPLVECSGRIGRAFVN